MAKRMLIDAAHPEETRVVVTSGTRLEEFDFESSTKKQVKGNIYLAKVTRVEPSLQAAFVDYGGNRHGFLAFSEIHPDYYRIPVSDRSAGEAERHTGNGHDAHENGGDEPGVSLAEALPEPVPVPDTSTADDEGAEEQTEPAEYRGDYHEPEEQQPEHVDHIGDESPPAGPAAEAEQIEAAAEESWRHADAPSEPVDDVAPQTDNGAPAHELATQPQHEPQPVDPFPSLAAPEEQRAAEPETIALRAAEELLLIAEVESAPEPSGEAHGIGNGAAEVEAFEVERVETFGGDEVEEVEEADAERRRTYHPARHYKIQEVIKRRQIMLVQVAKEERGNKGAALTTYLSLAGRYCVLMPNTNRGGGVSRKITSIADRRRLKDILEELDIPEGMGVIVRTAGAERSKPEIKRDYEYLLRLWNEIRDLTLNSTAPALIYEEGNLIKRSIRDLYTRDIDEVLVEGEDGYKTAKAFMRTLMPSHAKRVQPYRDPQMPLFQRFQIESQIDAIHSPVAQLRSGGYVVINQTEALVAIDVNSGRSTRERNIEETALRTNLEAAEELARQLRLRDLAGLIVIDFIDMEEHRNQIAVERRLKEALKNDRARIQVGRISPFGLLEMSRQRLRPSLAETSTQPCPHCGGTGFIRSVESTALYVLRAIEEEGMRRRSAEICVYIPTNVALYILNQKREALAQTEDRYGLKVMVARDDALIPPAYRLERLRAYGAGEEPPLRAIQAPTLIEEDEEDEVEAEDDIAEMPAGRPAAGTAEHEDADERGRRRRRRRRRRSDEPREARHPSSHEAAAAEPGEPAEQPASDEEETTAAGRESEADRRRRRRGRRGGRLRPRREEAAETAGADAPAAETIEIVPIEQEKAIEAETETLPELETWPGDTGVETAALAPFAGEAATLTPFAGEPAAPPPPEPHRELAPEPAPAPTAEAEAGVPFASEPERVLEKAAAAAAPPAQQEEAPRTPAPSPNDEVLAVTEKPANPRRGWWQRLTQS